MKTTGTLALVLLLAPMWLAEVAPAAAQPMPRIAPPSLVAPRAPRVKPRRAVPRPAPVPHVAPPVPRPGKVAPKVAPKRLPKPRVP